MGDTRHTLAVFIGRFQPFHIGHRGVLESLSGKADGALVLVGSAYRPRSWKNPFTYAERKGFIEAGVEGIDLPVDVLPLMDTLYNDRSWASNVRTAVKLYMRARGLAERETEIVLTGFDKDASSRYLRWFPEWEMLPADPKAHEGNVINATDLREEMFFPERDPSEIASRFGARHIAQVSAWMEQSAHAVAAIRDEGAYIRRYRANTAAAEEIFGYPIPINTVDAVVIQSGHILLVRRGVQPGKGTLALPGGHIDRGETAEEAAVRELYEETRLDTPRGALQGRLRGRHVFDHPERSERGWVRTEAFCFELQDREDLAKVKGSDDAEKAFWVPLSEVMPGEMFEDHFDIIQHFVPDVATSYSSILMAHAGDLK
ncbi:NUDIX domain-containing protein [Halovulum sp. GXIMD14794]